MMADGYNAMPCDAASDFKIHRRILQQLINAAYPRSLSTLVAIYGIIT